MEYHLGRQMINAARYRDTQLALHNSNDSPAQAVPCRLSFLLLLSSLCLLRHWCRVIQLRDMGEEFGP